jgi:hypothetical protein
MSHFVKCGDRSINTATIAEVDCSRIEDLIIVVKMKDGTMWGMDDIDAINFVYQVCPVMFEGKKMKYPKLVWMVHNLIAHPLMQILALFKLYKWAFYIHDKTVPKPIGKK